MERISAEELEDRRLFLEKLIRKTETALEGAPEGTLRFSRKGASLQYYWRQDPADTSGAYIRKEDRALAKKLAQKDYDRKVLRKANEELRVVNRMLSVCRDGRVEDLYETMEEPRQVLVRPVVLTDRQFTEKWEKGKYEKKEPPGGLTEFYTAKHERVRSKSEVIIADTLYRHQIPYRYECALKLRRAGIFHPDFTILDVRRRKTMIWEHMGRMDESDYCEKALDRLTIFAMHGYVPGKNLIVTYETKEHPLKTRLIERLIFEYDLSQIEKTEE